MKHNFERGLRYNLVIQVKNSKTLKTAEDLLLYEGASETVSKRFNSSSNGLEKFKIHKFTRIKAREGVASQIAIPEHFILSSKQL